VPALSSHVDKIQAVSFLRNIISCIDNHSSPVTASQHTRGLHNGMLPAAAARSVPRPQSGNTVRASNKRCLLNRTACGPRSQCRIPHSVVTNTSAGADGLVLRHRFARWRMRCCRRFVVLSGRKCAPLRTPRDGWCAASAMRVREVLGQCPDSFSGAPGEGARTGSSLVSLPPPYVLPVCTGTMLSFEPYVLE
jgi:hypothetical protein